MKTILKSFIVVLMLISTALPDALSLGKVPKGKTIDLESFELVWSDEFEGIPSIKASGLIFGGKPKEKAVTGTRIWLRLKTETL